MTRVKICGMMRKQEVECAARAGANAVGFVIEVPTSRHSLTVREAKELIDRVPVFMTSVAVIATDDIDRVTEIVLGCCPDLVQIHSDLTPTDMRKMKRAVSTGVIAAVPAVLGCEQRALALEKVVDAILIDTVSRGVLGGSGETHDWNLSAHLKAVLSVPLILAGGLTPVNVSKAIEEVGPYAVDVSSGVESGGLKDCSLIEAFIREAKLCSSS